MTQYAKYKSETEVEYAPRDIPGISNWIEDAEAVLAAGYLPVVEGEYPNDGKRYEARFAVRNNKINVSYIEIPFSRVEIELRRETLYRQQTDKLAAEYTRKDILGVLDDEEKAALKEQIRAISEQIVAENPYPVNSQGEAENA